LKPGISIGVAAFPADASDAKSLFQRADEALYRAKSAGKNRVCR
jgi:diguanylate cyclase (GGDEF)-like protein